LRLGSRAREILVALVERAGEVVKKRELMERVWPDTIVEEGALRVHIAALRKALGEGETGMRYVENVTGRGYRFVAPVMRVEQRRSAEFVHTATAEPPHSAPFPPQLLEVLDYIRAHGSAGVGARLRRVSERIDREANAVYARAGLSFDQRWMGPVHLLADRGEMTVGELAQELVIPQSSVSQTLRSLQSAKFVSERLDPRDARRRIQRLTKAGLAFVDKLRPIWLALMEAARDLEKEAIDLVTPLDRLEATLERKSWYERALGYLPESCLPGKTDFMTKDR
jgi:DNA-binding winged helix-turn-helix (wHTH) protein/DNA-binding MarR family transcriptional regulator